MRMSGTRSHFLSGARAAIPFVLVIGPFGLLFGVIASEAGLGIVETMSMSVLIIAGAAQITALQLMVDQAPTVIVLLTSLAVNLRMVMYSAALTPHLGDASLRTRILAAYMLTDQSFTVAISGYEREEMTLAQKCAYFFGAAVPLLPVWYGATLVGALLGGGLPPEFALDFALPITFLAMVAPMVRTLPHLIAAVVSIVGALAFAWVPYGGGLLVAAAFAMVAGAEAERRIGRGA